MDSAAIALLSVCAVACRGAFAASQHGLIWADRPMQLSTLSVSLANLTDLRPNTDIDFDKRGGVWLVKTGAVRLSPPPPASTFGRAPITPLTAAVGLVVAGFAAGMLILAVLLWIRSGAGWDFRFGDVLMVWLGRRRLMPVVPRDSLPRASAAAAAAAQEGEQAGRAGSQDSEQQRWGDASSSSAAAADVARTNSSAGLRDPEEGRGGTAAFAAAAGSGATQGARDGWGGGRPRGGEILPAVASGGADMSGPGATGTGPGPAGPAPPAYRTEVVVFGGADGPGRAAGPSVPGAVRQAF